jgi:hypothetical protein
VGKVKPLPTPAAAAVLSDFFISNLLFRSCVSIVRAALNALLFPADWMGPKSGFAVLGAVMSARLERRRYG